MANEIGNIRRVIPITLEIGEHIFKQDEELTVLIVTPNKITVARENGTIATLPTQALLIGTEKIA